MKIFTFNILFLLIFLLLTACSTTKITAGLTADVLSSGISAFYEESDLELARKGLESNIKLLEVFYKADTSNKTIRILLAQAYGGYSFMFLETEMLDTDRITMFYKRGLDYGLSVLKDQNPKFKKAMNNDDLELLTKAMKEFKEPNAIFWTVFNWALLINMNRSSVSMIAELPKLNILMDRLLELNPKFMYSAPLVLKATLDCSMPKMLGGKPEAGVELLEKALVNNKRSLLITQLMYAKYCAPAVQNKKVFLSMLDEINNFDLNENKDMILLNKTTQLKVYSVKKTTIKLFEDNND